MIKLKDRAGKAAKYALGVLGGVMLFGSAAFAAEMTEVSPLVMYAGENCEVYTDVETTASTGVILPAGTPITITGVTDDNVFRIDVDGTLFYARSVMQTAEGQESAVQYLDIGNGLYLANTTCTSDYGTVTLTDIQTEKNDYFTTINYKYIITMGEDAKNSSTSPSSAGINFGCYNILGEKKMSIGTFDKSYLNQEASDQTYIYNGNNIVYLKLEPYDGVKIKG